ncbi:MAG: xylulokinase [Spirochaetota bacterium]
MKAFIGVDIGTTGIRAGVYADHFSLIGSGQGKSIIKKGAHGELIQDAARIYSETASAVSQAVKNSGIDKKEIACISFTGQMAGLMGVDYSWKPVIPYDSWLDTRCSSQLEKIKNKAERLVISKTGNIPGFNHGPKIVWWKENEPEVFSRIARFVQPNGYAAGRLCHLEAEDAFLDWSFLHFSGFADNKGLQWDEQLLEMFGIPPEKMPRIVSPFAVIGEVHPEEAPLFDVPAGTPVAAGCGDTASSLLGTGAVKEGIAVDVAGTASVLAMTTDRMLVDYDGLIYSARSVLEDIWYSMSYINGGGMNLEWFKSTFASQTSFDQLNEQAEKIAPGSDGLIFIPHLEGRGYPPDPHMRGKWEGFTRNHSLGHFYRSILEGTGYEYALYQKQMKKILESEPSYEVRAIGGGAKSRVWNQIKADILGCRYCTINRDDVSILGQALAGAKAAGGVGDIAQTLEEVIDIHQVFDPDRDRHRRYEQCIEHYKKVLS